MILETDADRERLGNIARRYAQIEDDIKAAREDQKALVERAKNELGVPPKALKQAAKEMGWDGVEREAQRQLEDALDACRHALGLLAETPLGEAAQRMAKDIVGNGLGNSHPESKRGPGRPKGSKNKPKGETPPPPAIPDDSFPGAPYN